MEGSYFSRSPKHHFPLYPAKTLLETPNPLLFHSLLSFHLCSCFSFLSKNWMVLTQVAHLLHHKSYLSHLFPLLLHHKIPRNELAVIENSFQVLMLWVIFIFSLVLTSISGIKYLHHSVLALPNSLFPVLCTD